MGYVSGHGAQRRRINRGLHPAAPICIDEKLKRSTPAIADVHLHAYLLKRTPESSISQTRAANTADTLPNKPVRFGRAEKHNQLPAVRHLLRSGRSEPSCPHRSARRTRFRWLQNILTAAKYKIGGRACARGEGGGGRGHERRSALRDTSTSSY